MTIEKIVIKLICVVLGFVFLKSSVAKIQKPFVFFTVFGEYWHHLDHQKIIRLSSLFVALEFSLALLLITGVSSIGTLIVGTVTQLLYLLQLTRNHNREFVSNCNCFELNAPRKVTMRTMAINLSLFVLIIVLVGLSNRI